MLSVGTVGQIYHGMSPIETAWRQRLPETGANEKAVDLPWMEVRCLVCVVADIDV